MGQTTSRSSASTPAVAASQSSCPIQHSAPPTECPVPHKTPTSSASSSSTPAQCPVSHSDGVNPLNQMPTLSQMPAESQTSLLPTERTESSIPRDDTTRWDYPSPQQFHNALVRKGWETPEEHVEEMVQIHNFLNERAWLEVLRWEMRAQGDLPDGQRRLPDVQLARFKGRPGEVSPKARFWLLVGWLLPSRFNTEPPFDRHDWVVRRPATGEEVRYVIDYYSAPPLADGSPVFSLDVRPALDSFGSIKERIKVATEEAWTSWKEAKHEASRR
ncbi:hypothetical protein HGRIS_006482 [Hohenbuehelia grisea]|uniref:Holocytochrome c-type synthase n=1 Tax=Hohenbuehelia grisea TaxID=104357 RepID=A0ABR3K333_9AGAR